MSRYLYCDLKQKQGSDFIKVKEFNHLSYFTRDLFDNLSGNLKNYDLTFPIIEMNCDTEKINDIECGYQFIKLPYHKVENIVSHLKLVKTLIEKKFDFLGNYKINEEDVSAMEEDYNLVTHAIEELKYCLLYSKFELEDEETIFEFIIK